MYVYIVYILCFMYTKSNIINKLCLSVNNNITIINTVNNNLNVHRQKNR